MAKLNTGSGPEYVAEAAGSVGMTVAPVAAAAEMSRTTGPTTDVVEVTPTVVLGIAVDVAESAVIGDVAGEAAAAGGADSVTVTLAWPAASSPPELMAMAVATPAATSTATTAPATTAANGTPAVAAVEACVAWFRFDRTFGTRRPVTGARSRASRRCGSATLRK